MGTIIIKTNEKDIQAGQGALLHIPEELWELSKKHRVFVEDSQTGERVLVIDMCSQTRLKRGESDGKERDTRI